MVSLLVLAAALFGEIQAALASRRSPIHGVLRAQGAVHYPAVTPAMSSAG
jgi:hypothetical protein